MSTTKEVEMEPLYAVVSEILWETIDLLGYGQGPSEPYRIFRILAAPSPSAARYRAWQTDHSFEHDPREMPRFAVKKLGMTRRSPGDYTDDEKFWRRHGRKIFAMKAPDERDAAQP
jgi:hypothetical protein